jgi:hypothetical protein
VFKRFSPFFWYGVLALTYLVLSLTLAVNPKTLDRLNLDLAQYRLLTFGVILPYILIWFTAFFAYLKINQYARLLGGAREGPAFREIGLGIQVMAWGLAIPAIVSLVLRAIGVKYPGFEPTAIIISNYLTLLVPLIAYTLIGNGSHKLAVLSKAKINRNGFRLFVLMFLVLCVYYTFLTLYSRRFNGNPYHLSRQLTMLTIIIPYLYAWFLGFLSCYELATFARKIKGLLYKRALNLLTSGIGIMIVSSIFIQLINVVFVNDNSTSLGSLLILVYLLLVTEAIGFILIASGAKSLKRIEEI